MCDPIKTKIPAEMEPAALGGMVTDAKYIIDRNNGNKTQSQINAEVDTEITNSSESIANLDSQINGNGGIDDRLGTVEELGAISVGGGDIGIGTAADFESDDPSDLAKVPTIGAILGSMDDEPTAGSNNIIKSGGVAAKINPISDALNNTFYEEEVPIKVSDVNNVNSDRLYTKYNRYRKQIINIVIVRTQYISNPRLSAGDYCFI